MNDQAPVMVFEISVDPAEITEMSCAYGSISMLPFHGKVQSELFTGETLPGAVDVQQENAAGIRNMSARYAFRGHDSAGNPCTLFVDNEGWFRGSEKHDPVLHTCPSFLTDSPVLGDYLCRRRFRGEVRAAACGVEIWIFDVLADS